MIKSSNHQTLSPLVIFLSPRKNYFAFPSGEKLLDQIWKIYVRKIDKYIFFIKSRWIFTLFAFSFYIYRIITFGGFYFISYAMGLFLLQLTVQFFQPLGFPSIDDDFMDGDVYGDLPIGGQGGNEESKPLIRSVSEFKFWQNVTICICIAIFCSFFRIFDLPVYWPFLLFFFLVLMVRTAKKMLQHMNRFNYGFFYSSGKTKGRTIP